MHLGNRSVLLTNARIYTRFLPAPTALLIVDGRIAWLGLESQVEQFASVERVDCGGNWLSPAFADAHVHVTNTGIELTGLGLKSARSVADLRLQLDQKIIEQSNNSAAVVIGHGWDDSAWSERPTSADIDVELPVYLSRVDVHSALINEALVRRCPSITSLAGWDGSGRVTKAAHALARQTAMGLLSFSELSAARTAMLRMSARLGVVAVDEMSGPVISSADDARAVVEAGEDAAHPEVFLWWGELFGFDTAREVGAYGCGGDLFVDGSIGSQTACLHDEYIAGGRGARYIERAEILEHVETSTAHKMPTGFHAIGDSAIDDVMFAFSEVSRRRGDSRLQQLGHRIEHAEMTSSEHFSAAAKLNLAFSVQPQFDALWGGNQGMYSKRIGHRHQTMNDFAAMAEAGVALLLGSDAPVTDLNPWASVHAATTTHNSAHALSKRLAFSSHTRSFWRHRGRPDVGVIEVGAIAHLALWDVRAFDDVAAASMTSGRVPRWSLDPRSGVSALPNLEAGFPTTLQVWKYGSPMLSDGPGFTT